MKIISSSSHALGDKWLSKWFGSLVDEQVDSCFKEGRTETNHFCVNPPNVPNDEAETSCDGLKPSLGTNNCKGVMPHSSAVIGIDFAML